jgi:hypothetical protein
VTRVAAGGFAARSRPAAGLREGPAVLLPQHGQGLDRAHRHRAAHRGHLPGAAGARLGNKRAARFYAIPHPGSPRQGAKSGDLAKWRCRKSGSVAECGWRHVPPRATTPSPHHPITPHHPTLASWELNCFCKIISRKCVHKLDSEKCSRVG